jgi:cytochrome o ubiquinol oxidase operon protein cyoD
MSKQTNPSHIYSNLQTGVVSYLTGFLLSLFLTFSAYALVQSQILTGWLLAAVLVGLALVQVLVQLLFFLHLRHEAEPRWKLLVFDFMLVVVAILVFGTLWIMNNLNYHAMSPQQTDNQIMQDERIQR